MTDILIIAMIDKKILLCFVLLLYNVYGDLLSTDKRLPLVVENGKFSYLTRAQLPIDSKLKVADLCQVEVDDIQPLSSAVGFIKPKKFPCFFEPKTVIYQHEGSPLLSSDTVIVNIYFFRKLYSVVQNVTIQISIITPKTKSRVNLKSHLFVGSSKGISEALSSKVLEISFDVKKELCRMKHVNQAAGSSTIYPWVATRYWPLTGLLITFNKSKVYEFNMDCQQALLMGYRFMHRRSRSPSVDFLPLIIEISNVEKKVVVDTTYLYIPILIAITKSFDIFKNLLPPPVIETFRTAILKNSGGTISLLPKDILEIRSQDKNRGPLIAKIVSLQGNDMAKFVNMRAPSKEIWSFTLNDLKEGLIGFQLLSYSETIEKVFRVDLIIYDSYFVQSDPVILKIVDELDSDNQPFQVFTTPFHTYTGNVRHLRYNNIQIIGQINHSLIKYRLLNINTTYGSLNMNPSINLFNSNKAVKIFFNMDEIKNNQIFYKHYGGLEEMDLIKIEASIDRFRFIRFYLPVYIVRVYNRSKETLLKSTVEFLTPTEGLMALSFPKLINWAYYYIVQRDNIDIFFSIVKKPRYGRFLKLFPFENITKSSILTTPFNIQDLLNGFIYFQSSPSSSNNRDHVKLHQIGKADSETTDIYFNIRFYIINFLIPKMDPNVVFNVLETSQYAKLSYLNLNFVNNNLKPLDITYKITRCPVHIRAKGTVDSGRLVSLKSIQNLLLIGDTVLTTKITDYRSAQITSVISFTQQQILDNDIVYIPPAEDVGPQDQKIQFLYSVKDSYGYEIRNLPFTILVKAVNNQQPFLKVSGAIVQRDEEIYLSKENIDFEDIDTNIEDLSIQLMQLPNYGQLTNEKNVIFGNGSKFSATQLVEKSIRYKHNGYNVKKDFFKIRIFDRVQFSPVYDVILNITKRIVSNSDWNFYINNSVMVKENQTITLHQTALQNVMKDFDFISFSDPTFILVSMPTRGNLIKDDNVISTFYYEEVKSGKIKYKHTATEIGSKAQFDFTQIWVLESGLSFNMNFTILPVNSQSPVIYSQTPLQVNEGGFGIVSYYTLGVKDSDSKVDDIKIKVIRPPMWGKICFASNRAPANMFSVADIKLGKLLYVNNKYLNGLEQTNDAFVVEAFDGEFSSSHIEIQVIIHPTNDEIPKLELKDFNIAIGENRTLDEKIFQVSDADIPRDPLQIFVTRFPLFGNLTTLYKHGEVKSINKNSPPFTLQMLKFVSILYTQNPLSIDVEKTKFPVKDEFELSATDGKHNVFNKCIVNITGRNIFPPVIFTSLIQLNKVSEKIITNLELQVKDKDTLAEDIVFKLLISPKTGELYLENKKISLNQGFTQRNINDGKIKYKYLGKSISYGKDSFTIKVMDGTFETKSKIIYIFMTQPIQKPKMVISVSTIPVEIGRRFVLDRGIFKIENPIPEIINLLIITVAKRLTCGSLYHYKNLDNSITKFSFEDLEKRKILLFISECPDVVKFMNIPISINYQQKFEQTSNIYVQILPRTNLPPVLEKNNPIEALVRSNVVLTKERLLVLDPDTPSDKITFQYIKRNDSSVLLFIDGVESETFTQYDINSQKVVLAISDSTNVSKTFLRLHVTDGHNEGYISNSNLQLNGILNFSVIISAWIHKDLILLRYSSPTEMKFIDGYNAFAWTFNNILVSRDEAEISSAVELVAGFFYNIKSKQLVNSFSQIDINKGFIYYFLHKERSTIVYQEIFTFKIVYGSFRISSESLTLKWSILEFEKTKYKLCPQRGLLSVGVLRRGDLSIESQALVGFISKEAVIDQDYRLMSQRLLIFLPGQQNNTISIKILLSGSVTSAARFHVTLKSPKQAVFGKNSMTVVSIKDRNVCVVRKYFLPERSLKPITENNKIQGVRDMIQDVNPESEFNSNKNYLPSSEQLEMQYSNYLQRKKYTIKCMKGWYTFLKRCYHPFHNEVSWKFANKHCAKFDSYLVSISSDLILNWLLKLFRRPHSFWLGLHRLDASDEWKYPNNDAVVYTKWGTGFPKKSGHKHRDCVIVTKRGIWKNRPCLKKKSYFICMKNPQVLI